MATATRKKSAAYEQGVREGRADKSKKAPMEMEKGEGKAHESAESPDEESSEGPEPDDAPRFGSRKRSAKDAKNTKAPMDAECGATPGKKCSACKSGKPCSGRAMKDAGCGGKKMDSALTPYEYLSACDLGIQDKPRSYIRARLDSVERLDLKCGNGSISKGEKCSKGTAQEAKKSKITLTGENGIWNRNRIAKEGYYGAPVGGNSFGRKSQAKRYGALNAGLGTAVGAIAGGIMGGAKGAAIGAAFGGAYGGVVGAGTGAVTAQINRASSRAANRSLQREAFEKPLAASYEKTASRMHTTGASNAKVLAYNEKTAMKLAEGYDKIQKRTKGRYGVDSMYAAGFTTDLSQLAI